MQWTRETDVVVIGGGLAGYCAALEAADAQANVLLLEKQPQAGGSTALSGGFLAFAGTDLQKAAGIDDSNARLADDLRKAGANENDPRLIDVYVANQMATYEWLTSIGVKFSAVELSSAQSVPRTHPTDPQVLLARLDVDERAVAVDARRDAHVLRHRGAHAPAHHLLPDRKSVV